MSEQDIQNNLPGLQTFEDLKQTESESILKCGLFNIKTANATLQEAGQTCSNIGICHRVTM